MEVTEVNLKDPESPETNPPTKSLPKIANENLSQFEFGKWLKWLNAQLATMSKRDQILLDQTENNYQTLIERLMSCESRLTSLEQRLGPPKTGPCEAPGWEKPARDPDEDLID